MRARSTRAAALAAVLATSTVAALGACTAIIGIKNYGDEATPDASSNVQMDSTVDAVEPVEAAAGDDTLDANGGSGDDAASDASTSLDADGSCGPTSYCAMILDAGPRAYFRFDELAADAHAPVYDWSGHDASITLAGETSAGAGAPIESGGTALQLGDTTATSGGSISVDGLTAPQPPFTVEFWFLPFGAAQTMANNAATQIPLRVQSTSGTFQAGFRLLAGSSVVKPLLELTDDGTILASSAAPAAIASNAFVHIAATYDGTTGYIFLAGARGGAATPGNAYPFQDSGRLTSSSVFGELDEIAIYDHVLSDAEITNHATFRAP